MIKLSANKLRVNEIQKQLKENGGYCPCKLIKNEDNKCMCKEFRDMKSGTCHCGLYVKVDNDIKEE